MDGKLSSQTSWCEAQSFQPCPTLRPYDLPSSSVHGILQARVLKWVAFVQGIFLTQGSNPGLLVSCIGKRILYHSCPWRSLLKYGQFVLPEVNSDFSKVSAAESSFPAAHESSGTRGQPSISRTTTVTRSSPASPLPHLPRSIAHVKHLQVQETLSNMGGSWESQEQGLHHSNADDFTGSLKHTLTLQSGLYMRLGLQAGSLSLEPTSG